MKKQKLLLCIGIALCAIVFYLANTAQFLGKFINQLSPCVQDPMNSFPCYGVYDIGIAIGAMVIGLFFAGVLLSGFLRRR